jgi:hypothetical protein
LLSENRNLPVSTEITGYALSAFLWSGLREPARRAADFLVYRAWRPSLRAMPFELDEPLPPSYFFDCGIIVRGLLRAWRVFNQSEYLIVAREIGLSMGRDFLTARGVVHPVIELPSKKPLPYEKRWSREPGCFELKSALGWLELADLYPGEPFQSWFEQTLRYSLAAHHRFLPGSDDPHKVMDRLHAYLYFLEALLAKTGRPECAAAFRCGLDRAAGFLREIGSQFERSDVCAQLLRVRLLAAAAQIAPLDFAAAEEEAWRLETHRRVSGPRMIRGGFSFGTKDGLPLPYMNPVSSAFGMQALAWWSDWRAGRFQGSLSELI